MGGQVLRWSEYRSMPWKNGGGTTREVASGTVRAPGAPAGASIGLADGFDWRVSVADVAAGGPFSAFPGVDRVITLVEGEGMVLTVDGRTQRVGPLRPFAFPGDAATDCRLEAGVVRDMNVMTRRGRATARVRIVPVTDRGPEVACAADEVLLIMATSGQATAVGPDLPETALDHLDCVRHEGAGALALRGDGTVAEIRISTAR